MPPLLSVQQFVTLVNDTLGMIPSGAFLIEGEVAEYKVAQGKWITFTLKDEDADVRLPCFATTFKGLPTLIDGMRVRVTGFASVFPRFGKFSLNIESAEPVGEGELKKAYLALKEKLTKEGIFDASHKRALPKFPERIGIITSREAAAFGDFLRVLRERMGGLTLIHADVHVQGQYAVEEICAAFTSLQHLPEKERPEVLVLTRGGGSYEELHAFNDEQVVRAVFASRIPVVVAVGHERDETLADFAADVRAATPTHAAECVVQKQDVLLSDVKNMAIRMHMHIQRTLTRKKSMLERTILVIDQAFAGVEGRLQGMVERMGEYLEQSCARVAARIQANERFLSGVNPQAVLQRGYAVVRTIQGKLVRTPEQVAQGEHLSVHLAQGALCVEVVKESSPTQRCLDI